MKYSGFQNVIICQPSLRAKVACGIVTLLIAPAIYILIIERSLAAIVAIIIVSFPWNLSSDIELSCRKDVITRTISPFGIIPFTKKYKLKPGMFLRLYRSRSSHKGTHIIRYKLYLCNSESQKEYFIVNEVEESDGIELTKWVSDTTGMKWEYDSHTKV